MGGFCQNKRTLHTWWKEVLFFLKRSLHTRCGNSARIKGLLTPGERKSFSFQRDLSTPGVGELCQNTRIPLHLMKGSSLFSEEISPQLMYAISARIQGSSHTWWKEILFVRKRNPHTWCDDPCQNRRFFSHTVKGSPFLSKENPTYLMWELF